VHDRRPNYEPSKIFDADFRGEFARFEFNDVSETIGNDRSISHFIGHAAHFCANVKNTVNA
jgi:hypothetical protein